MEGTAPTSPLGVFSPLTTLPHGGRGALARLGDATSLSW
jgi:hypothetical protein